MMGREGFQSYVLYVATLKRRCKSIEGGEGENLEAAMLCGLQVFVKRVSYCNCY